MPPKYKLLIKEISSQGNYNELDLEKSNLFLKNLQDFVVDIGVAKVDPREGYEDNGKFYDIYTFYTLFQVGHKDDSKTIKSSIKSFSDGHVARYFNKKIELLIIFLQNKIKLIFYCDQKNRKMIMNALFKFCEVMNFSKNILSLAEARQRHAQQWKDKKYPQTI